MHARLAGFERLPRAYGNGLDFMLFIHQRLVEERWGDGFWAAMGHIWVAVDGDDDADGLDELDWSAESL